MATMWLQEYWGNVTRMLQYGMLPSRNIGKDSVWVNCASMCYLRMWKVSSLMGPNLKN